MTVSITTSFIKSLATNQPTQRTEHRDSSIRGFLVRHSPSGHIAYYAQLRRAKRVRIGSHPTVTAAQARDAARKLISAETLGQYQDRPRVMRVGAALHGVWPGEKSRPRQARWQRKTQVDQTAHVG